MKKAIKIGLKVDAFLQGVLLLGIIGFGITSLIYSGFVYLYGLMLLAFLGFWQVFSALVFGFALRDVALRGLYLLGVLGFFTTNFILTVSDILLPMKGFAYVVLALSTLSVASLTIRYFSITIQDMVRHNTSYVK